MSREQHASGGQEGGRVQQQGDNTRRPTVADRTQRRDAYTVIAPDEEKRKTVQENAAKEEQKFQEFREGRRLHHVSYVGTVGDGEAAAGNVQPRRAAVNTQQPRLTSFDKTRQHRTAQRQREESEITKKKQEQRLKATANEDRERQRKERLDEDRKKKMNAFLDQFESKSKHSTLSREAAAAVTANDKNEADMKARSDEGGQSSLDLLQAAFPHHSREELEEMLAAFDGDVDSVFEMMSC